MRPTEGHELEPIRTAAHARAEGSAGNRVPLCSPPVSAVPSTRWGDGVWVVVK